MMIYDEFLRMNKIKPSNNGIEFILSIYRWKNGGPKPNMNYSIIIKNKKYTAAEIIGRYLKQDDTGMAAVRKLVSFYYSVSQNEANERNLKYLRGVTDYSTLCSKSRLGWRFLNNKSEGV